MEIRHKITYVAVDGEEFENEKDCRWYEEHISHLPASMRWYDEYGNRLNPQSVKEIDEMYNEVMVWEILDVKGWKDDLKFMVSYFGFGEWEWKPGRYLWIEDKEIDEDWLDNHTIYGWNEWEKLLEGEFYVG